MDDGLVRSPALDVAPEPPPQPTASLSGNLDGVHGRCVEGWVFEPAAPSRKITVEIFDDARLLGTAPARLFRGDLASAGVGDGSMLSASCCRWSCSTATTTTSACRFQTRTTRSEAAPSA